MVKRFLWRLSDWYRERRIVNKAIVGAAIGVLISLVLLQAETWALWWAVACLAPLMLFEKLHALAMDGQLTDNERRLVGYDLLLNAVNGIMVHKYRLLKESIDAGKGDAFAIVQAARENVGFDKRSQNLVSALLKTLESYASYKYSAKERIHIRVSFLIVADGDDVFRIKGHDETPGSYPSSADILALPCKTMDTVAGFVWNSHDNSPLSIPDTAKAGSPFRYIRREQEIYLKSLFCYRVDLPTMVGSTKVERVGVLCADADKAGLFPVRCEGEKETDEFLIFRNVFSSFAMRIVYELRYESVAKFWDEVMVMVKDGRAP